MRNRSLFRLLLLLLLAFFFFLLVSVILFVVFFLSTRVLLLSFHLLHLLLAFSSSLLLAFLFSSSLFTFFLLVFSSPSSCFLSFPSCASPFSSFSLPLPLLLLLSLLLTELMLSYSCNHHANQRNESTRKSACLLKNGYEYKRIFILPPEENSLLDQALEKHKLPLADENASPNVSQHHHAMSFLLRKHAFCSRRLLWKNL